MWNRRALAVVALCVLWYCASAGSNVVAKLALAEFPFPATLALVQLLSAAVWSEPLLLLRGERARGAPLKQLAPLALAKALTALCSVASLWRVPVSFAHTVKATTPLWTALVSRWALGERLQRRAWAALALIAGGVALASATELQLELWGLLAALAAAALLSLQHVYSKRVLIREREPPLRLLRTLSWLALVPATPVWLWLEASPLISSKDSLSVHSLSLVVAAGFLSYVQAVLAFSVLALVTPLTYAVASSAKRVAVVCVSVLVLRNPVSPLNAAGMTVAALGVFAYNRARITARASPPPAPRLLPL